MAVLLQPRCACRVEGGLIRICVYLTVELNDEAKLVADEVDDEGPNGDLATELRA